MEGYKCPRCGVEDSILEVCTQGVVANSQGVFDPDNMGDITDTKYCCWNCDAEFGSRIEEGGLVRLVSRETDYSKRSLRGYEVIYRGERAVVLFRPSTPTAPYIVAHGYNDSTGTWSQGTYDISDYFEARNMSEGAM